MMAPGQTLRHYLSGARRPYVNPGRYLLFAILFRGGIYQLMKWTGVVEGDTRPDATVDAIQAAYTSILPWSTGYIYIAWICLLAGLLGLLYRQLFTSKTRDRTTASAIAVFVAAHGLIVGTFLQTGWRLFQYAMMGDPLTGSWTVFSGTFLGYAGLATYQCFQSHWTDVLKAVFAIFWAIVEMVSVGVFITLGYAGLLFLIDPETYPLMATEGGEIGPGPTIVLLVFLAILASLPLLLHVGVAAYARSR
jgi:hypothetical protein